MEARTLDHVAFWVAERDAITEVATRDLGMHVIDRQENFTLVGSDARRGKLTLFDAEAPRDRGPFKHVALRVSKLEGADRGRASGRRRGRTLVEAPTDVEYDLDHVALFTADPEATAEAYLDFGFQPAEPKDGIVRVEVGGAYVEFHEGDPGSRSGRCSTISPSSSTRRTSTSATPRTQASRSRASSTRRTRYAVFLWGPDRVRIEYVEHKPSFSLT